jgi:GcrA cell cycle regulator
MKFANVQVMNKNESIPPPARAGDLLIPPNERKTLRALEQNECRWPYGNPRRKDFYYCGKLAVAGHPYCEFHMRRAFQPTRAREFRAH